MSNVKWIKLTTDMFDDEKIKLIEQMPEADTILVIWIKLLSQAGKTNASGYIFLSENIPYTEEMLATIFNRPLNTVRLALDTLKSFGMIDIDDDSFISIANWEKHQNIDGLNKIREQTRKRVAKHRERKQIEAPKKEVTDNVTLRNATEEELELEVEVDKYVVEKLDSDYSIIVSYLNKKANKHFRDTTRKTRSLINARKNEGFNVDNFKIVIDKKTSEWLNDAEMNKYLRPETLFGTKFESYLNQETITNTSKGVANINELNFDD